LLACHVLQPTGRKDAGIGTQHIEPAVSRRCRLHHSLHAGQRSDITRQSKGRRTDFLRGGFGLIEMARHHGHPGPRRGKHLGNAFADALAAPCDQHRTVL